MEPCKTSLFLQTKHSCYKTDGAIWHEPPDLPCTTHPVVAPEAVRKQQHNLPENKQQQQQRRQHTVSSNPHTITLGGYETGLKQDKKLMRAHPQPSTREAKLAVISSVAQTSVCLPWCRQCLNAVTASQAVWSVRKLTEKRQHSQKQNPKRRLLDLAETRSRNNTLSETWFKPLHNHSRT